MTIQYGLRKKPAFNLAGQSILLVGVTEAVDDLVDAHAEVEVATSDDAALAALARDPAMIICDLDALGDGFHFLRRVRVRCKRGQGPIAIALSERQDPITRTMASLAGYLRFLAKPVRPLELVAAATELVTLPHAL